VAGFAEGHPDSAGYEEDLRHLKAKVEAGADFVITQLFFDVERMLSFIQDCRAAGIECPILPGVMPIQSYTSFRRVVEYCKVAVPGHIWESLEPIKDDDAAVKRYGVQLAASTCRRLLDAGVPGVHFYTLNLERSVRRVLDEVGLGRSRPHRSLPWRPSADAKRAQEDVRPIFWANRPESYLTRTASWDEFPNGRWGDFRSPAFGELSHHLVGDSMGPAAERRRLWGEALVTVEDLGDVFAHYVLGEIPRLPWCTTQLARETSVIQEQLARLNRSGFLTINSQPRVAGLPSDDPMFGWGGPGGFVYQKAYVEFFCSPKVLAELMAVCERHPNLVYHASDHAGNTYTNSTTEGPTAVTWGVFPNKEILQPTVVDPASFLVWKDEAFSLWLQVWAPIYDEESTSSEIIHTVHDTFFLVNLVDNDFMRGDIFAVFNELLAAREAERQNPPAEMGR